MLIFFDSGAKSAGFGAAAGVAALLYVSGIPRVKTDILQVRSIRHEDMSRKLPC
jgi:hypothetical protein